MEPSLTPYVRARIVQEQIGLVLASMSFREGTCPNEKIALFSALEEIEALADELETKTQ